MRIQEWVKFKVKQGKACTAQGAQRSALSIDGTVQRARRQSLLPSKVTLRHN